MSECNGLSNREAISVRSNGQSNFEIEKSTSEVSSSTIFGGELLEIFPGVFSTAGLLFELERTVAIGAESGSSKRTMLLYMLRTDGLFFVNFDLDMFGGYSGCFEGIGDCSC